MTTRDNHDQFHLSGAWNFRDLGGLRTVDGRTVKSGLFFRSSELSRLDDAGQRTLAELGVTDVFDFRRHSEIEKAGADRAPDSVRVHHVPYQDSAQPSSAVSMDDQTAQSRTVPDAETQYANMISGYTEFPVLPGAKQALSSVFSALMDGDGSILVHCAAGKDRAGWTAATVLRALGVSDDAILEDYLRSNDAVEPLRRHVMSVWGIDPESDVVDALTDTMLGVQEAYYEAGMGAVVEHFGSFDAYLEVLGVDAEKVQFLRDRMLS